MVEYINKEQVKDLIMGMEAIPFAMKVKYSEEVERLPHKEMKNGTWEKGPLGYLCCSECHNCYILPEWLDEGKWNFCANCGADLRGDAGESV